MRAPGYQGMRSSHSGPVYDFYGDLQNVPSWRINAKGLISIAVMDADDKIQLDEVTLDELKMVDAVLPWWFQDEIPGSTDPNDHDRFKHNVCSNPVWHDMKKIVYFNIPYLECDRCGFCPDLDQHKPRYKKAYLDWVEYYGHKKT
jgi:hypothetical protein